MTKRTDRTTSMADREIVITRVFDALRELVWEAWTAPDRLRKWWGPKGFTMLTLKLDLRRGYPAKA